MTYKFILIYRFESTDAWSMLEGKGECEEDFLKSVDNGILKAYEWVVYRIDKGTHKDQYLHSGKLDNIIPE